MAEPTFAMTFQDLIVDVAEFLGFSPYSGGEGVASIPTDAHDLDLCKRLVNAGWRRFINSNPRWEWQSPTFSITFDPDGETDIVVDGSGWRYYMPDGFYGQILGNFTYSLNSGRPTLSPAPDDYVLAMRANSDSSGYPAYYALRPLGGDDARRWEVIFWPTPQTADTITARCLIYPNKLVELTDKPNAGFQFDEAIRAASLSEAEKTVEDASGEKTADWAEALTRAIAMDQRSAPTRLGDYGGNVSVLGRPYSGVDTYTALDGTVTAINDAT